MMPAFSDLRRRLSGRSCLGCPENRVALILILAAWLPCACARFGPPPIQRDMAAERVITGLRQTNAALTRFRCVAKVTLSGSQQPLQSFRAAIVGSLTDRFRMDLFAPLGGSAGTVASDGKHLFLVMHRSREYHKRRLGSGSLRRLIHMEITVGDLLELLMGRIPLDTELSPRLISDRDRDRTNLVLLDRRGRLRQRITLDASMRPESVVWFDNDEKPTRTLTLTGSQTLDGFVLPKHIDLSNASGQRVGVALDRYEANAAFDEKLFVLPPLSS